MFAFACGEQAFNLEIYLMAEQSVVGVFENTTQARAAIDKLVASGFPSSNISLVTKSLDLRTCGGEEDS